MFRKLKNKTGPPFAIVFFIEVFVLTPKERFNFCSWLSVCSLRHKLCAQRVVSVRCDLVNTISFGLLILLLNKRRNKALAAHLKVLSYDVIVMNDAFFYMKSFA
jgi:hypothetical protein